MFRFCCAEYFFVLAEGCVIERPGVWSSLELFGGARGWEPPRRLSDCGRLAGRVHGWLISHNRPARYVARRSEWEGPFREGTRAYITRIVREPRARRLRARGSVAAFVPEGTAGRPAQGVTAGAGVQGCPLPRFSEACGAGARGDGVAPAAQTRESLGRIDAGSWQRGRGALLVAARIVGSPAAEAQR